MEGSEAVLGSSVNFAVCTRDVPPATNGLTDCQKRYHRPTSNRNVDYSSVAKEVLKKGPRLSSRAINAVVALWLYRRRKGQCFVFSEGAQGFSLAKNQANTRGFRAFSQ
jgi:hypothetical protein